MVTLSENHYWLVKRPESGKWPERWMKNWPEWPAASILLQREAGETAKGKSVQTQGAPSGLAEGSELAGEGSRQDT